MSKVYLAGPIRGLTYSQAAEWRTEFRERLHPAIQAFSPLRGKEFLDDGKVISGTYPEPLATGKAIAVRDGHDVMTCDVLVVNALGITEVSGGTSWELGIAWALRKPVVLITDQPLCPYLVRYPMADSVGFVVTSINEAVVVVEAICLPV